MMHSAQLVQPPTTRHSADEATVVGRQGAFVRLSSWCAAHPILWTVLIGVVACAVAWLRLPSIARDTLWAEDGRNFIQDALNSGPVAVLFNPYAGYLQFLPRLIAGVTVQFVLVSGYAVAMTAGSCIAAGVMASIVFVCSADVIRWMPARVVVASLTVLAPLVPREVSGNTANLHSLVLWTMFWIILYRPRTRIGGYLLGLFALIGGLTEIQAVFLLPLLLWRVRDRALVWPRVGYLLGVGAQLCATVLWPRQPNTNPAVGFASVAYGFIINSVVPVWIPQPQIGPALAWGGITLGLALCIPFALAVVICVRYGSRRERVAALGLVGLAVVIYCASVYENPQSFYQYAHLSSAALKSVWLARYGVVPSMMLCALIPLAATVGLRRERVPAHHGRVSRVVSRGAVIVLVLLLLVQFGPQDTRRSHGPAWQPQITALRPICAQLPDQTLMAVNETLGWQVDISCGRIE